MSIRSASHAGSWYENDGNRLGRELEEWLNSATAKVNNQKHPEYYWRDLNSFNPGIVLEFICTFIYSSLAVVIQLLVR